MSETKKTIFSIQFFILIGVIAIQMFGGEAKKTKKFHTNVKKESVNSNIKLETYKDKGLNPTKISQFHSSTLNVMQGEFNTDCQKLFPLQLKIKTSTNKYVLDLTDIEQNYNSLRQGIVKNKNDFSATQATNYKSELVNSKIGMGNAQLYENNVASLTQNVKDLTKNVASVTAFLNQLCTTQMLLGGFDAPVLEKIKNWFGYSLYLLDRWIDTRYSKSLQKMPRRKLLFKSFNKKEMQSFKGGVQAGMDLVQIIDNANPRPAMLFLNKVYGIIGENQSYNKSISEHKFAEFMMELAKNHKNEKEISEFLYTFDVLSKLLVFNGNTA